jgi:arsenite-transporting ATPase
MKNKIIIFGGKGGVGKSTTACATAVWLARLNPAIKIMIVSFDMAHNLSDLFDMEIGDKITQILQVPNLWAMEPDAERETDVFVKEFVDKAKELAYTMPLVKRLTNLEQYINESFSAASIPLAVKNSIFFDDILENFDRYDLFIIDMPPTGNMVSILEVPKTTMQVFLKSTLETMDNVMQFIHNMNRLNPVTWFRRGSENRKNMARDLLGMLKELDRRGDRISKLLRESASLRFVTIAERPSFEEIRRTSKYVEKYTNLDGVIINKINPEGLECRYCVKESAMQQKYIVQIEDYFKGKSFWKAQKLEDEAIGVDALSQIAEMLYDSQSFEQIVDPSRPTGDETP